jgi:hypothetical protein
MADLSQIKEHMEIVGADGVISAPSTRSKATGSR